MTEYPFRHFITESKTLDELSLQLERYLAIVEIFDENGTETIGLYLERAVVERIGNLRIEIRTKEQCHNIPHFHITSPDIDASFTISDCDIIAGNVDGKTKRKINRFYNKDGGREILIHFWNLSRPTDHPTDPIK